MSEAARVLLGVLVAIVACGTVFFHLVEGWSWIDSYFFTVVTLSTVGYGNLVPATALGKVATTVFIFVGLGIFAAAIQHFGRFAVLRRAETREKLRAARRAAAEAEKRLEAAGKEGPDA